MGHDPAAALTDGQSAIVAAIEEGKLRRTRELSSIPFPNSLAWLYTQITTLLGFSASASEHKTQWLSLSGEPVYEELFVEMLGHGSKEAPNLNRKFFNRGFAGNLAFSGEFYRRLGIPEGPLAEVVTQDPVNALRRNLASSCE